MHEVSACLRCVAPTLARLSCVPSLCKLQLRMLHVQVVNHTEIPASDRSRKVEVRKPGCFTATIISHDPPAWSQLHSFVKQLDQSAMSSLSAFSKAIATHYYSTAGSETAGRVGYSLSQLEPIDFWQTDLLAGLLMQALMIFISQDDSKPAMMFRLATLSANINFNPSELDNSLLQVPDVTTADASTNWLKLYWNFLRIATDWIYAETGSDDSSEASVYIEELVANLHASFSPNQPGANKALDVRRCKYWGKDCLATALFRALEMYLDTDHAFLDGKAIQEWLVSHSKASPRSQQITAAPEPVGNQPVGSDGQSATMVDAVDVANMQAAIADMNSGSGVAALAKLEQRLLQHFQASAYLRCVDSRISKHALWTAQNQTI